MAERPRNDGSVAAHGNRSIDQVRRVQFSQDIPSSLLLPINHHPRMNSKTCERIQHYRRSHCLWWRKPPQWFHDCSFPSPRTVFDLYFNLAMTASQCQAQTVPHRTRAQHFAASFSKGFHNGRLGSDILSTWCLAQITDRTDPPFLLVAFSCGAQCQKFSKHQELLGKVASNRVADKNELQILVVG